MEWSGAEYFTAILHLSTTHSTHSTAILLHSTAILLHSTSFYTHSSAHSTYYTAILLHSILFILPIPLIGVAWGGVGYSGGSRILERGVLV